MSKLVKIGLAGADASTGAKTAACALDEDDDSVFTTEEGDAAPSWTASLKGFVESPVCQVTVYADPRKESDPHGLHGITLEVMSDAKTVVWQSPVQIPPPATEIVHFHVPEVPGRRIRIVKSKEYGKGPLAFRRIECKLSQEKKYKLSKSILTIDKFSVAQPFTLTELAHSTAYGNLFTTSARCELQTQESMQEEREQEALNLTHHLAGIWDGPQRGFQHGNHIGTVRIVFLSMLENVKAIFAREPRLVDVPAPSYIFGDIHGNFQDLLYFMSNLIPFKHIKYSSHNYVFLGDYVDRGRYDVECVAYLIALKVQAPNKVFLLRGNHEDRRQNAKLEESYLKHCVELFGKTDGHEVWEKTNEVFDLMPLCAVVDDKLFCAHGGVPRTPIDPQTGKLTPIRQIVNKVSVPLQDINDSEDNLKQLACDLLWADPASDKTVSMFDRNESRGCSCVFGQAAIEEFLEVNKFESIFRAHQWYSFGVNIAKSAKVITLFTSSNYCDNNSCAGCALVAADKRIQLLMKEHSPEGIENQ